MERNALDFSVFLQYTFLTSICCCMDYETHLQHRHLAVQLRCILHLALAIRRVGLGFVAGTAIGTHPSSLPLCSLCCFGSLGSLRCYHGISLPFRFLGYCQTPLPATGKAGAGVVMTW